MQNSRKFLAWALVAALASCAAGPKPSYPANTRDRLALYAKATPCCDDPSGFSYAALPAQGFTETRIDRASPVFDFHSGVSPFVAYALPKESAPYRLRVKSLIDPGENSAIFYPVIAVLDDTFIVTQLTGLDNLRLEPALATAGGETGLTVTLPIDPADGGKYMIIFTPAALLGAAPDARREGDVLTPAVQAWMERRGEAMSPASPYGRLMITVAPEPAVANTSSAP